MTLLVSLMGPPGADAVGALAAGLVVFLSSAAAETPLAAIRTKDRAIVESAIDFMEGPLIAGNGYHQGC